MLIKGTQCRQASHLTFRSWDYSLDTDTNGELIPESHGAYVAILRVKNCPIRTNDDETQTLITDNVPSIPLDHTRTNAGHGKKRYNSNPTILKTKEGTWERVDQYWSCPVYYVIDGRVWRGTVKWHVKPEEIKEKSPKIA